jgi:UDP-N-acetylmuramate--alanine ligase
MSQITGRVHLVGIGGMHMSAIGQLLIEQGVAVSGSDLRLSPFTTRLEAMGAEIREGHAAGNLGDASLVVTTGAASEDNPEIAEARRRGIPVLLRAEMVARLMVDKEVIAVAGSHGKTTTSSLIAFILREAGKDPMYLLGGESPDLGGHAAWGGPLCVVEADEYKRAFHEYSPRYAVITNVEPDHLDYFGTGEAYEQAFVEFGERVVDGGLLLTCADDAGAMRVAGKVGKTAIQSQKYSLDAAGNADWMGTGLALEPGGAAFRVVHDGRDLGGLRTRVPARHFAQNALAAAAISLQCGVAFDQVQTAVAAFRGARRRFEEVGEAGGVLVMDDFAHHPTEVRATIAAAKAAFPERRLIGIYQPHTYTRIAYLWDQWLGCWEGLDALIVVETYAARERPEAGRSAAELAGAIKSPKASFAKDFDDAVRQAAALVTAGDVVFTIGAGDVSEVGPMLLEALG